MLTYNGVTKSQSQWARALGLYQSTISERIRKGWTEGQALGLEPPPPKKSYGCMVTYQGETLTLMQWKFRTKIDSLTIRYRMQQGWTAGQALGYEPPPTQETDNADPQAATSNRD